MLTRPVVRGLSSSSSKVLRGGASASKAAIGSVQQQQPQQQRHYAAAAPSPNDPFANGTNSYYADEMFRLWKQDPKSVHASWDVYFRGMEKGLPSHQAFQPPPSTLPVPSDGAPALHAAGGGDLDVHLKVRTGLLSLGADKV
jgi:2-oxoglutarate dehydrogenase E1 component